MKTFDQYISQTSANEARQSYIFGGTDNRNTEEDKQKSFSQLKDGDYIYWWVNSTPHEIRECVFKSWSKNLHGTFYTYENSYTMEFLDEKQKVYKEYYGNKIFIASTDAELLIDTVNDIGKWNVNDKCIISEKEYYKKHGQP